MVKPPQAPSEEPQAKDQASVDIATHLIVEHHVSQHTNDKQEIEPALAKLGQLPECLGTIENLLADTGYFSQGNVKACCEATIKPYFAQKRQSHNQSLDARYQHEPEIDETALMPVEAMPHRLTTKAGKALYGKRKSTVETVFGIIKHFLGFRQFHRRGLESSKRMEFSLYWLEFEKNVCVKRVIGRKIALVSS